MSIRLVLVLTLVSACTMGTIDTPNQHMEQSVSCGDGVCVDESCATCSDDCGTCPSCGDGMCNPSEDCATCAADCGICPTNCGDGTCDTDEDCSSCSADCGQCTSCGDGTCDADEDCTSCPTDCGTCPGCGDGTCGASEDCISCAADCGTCPGCGDGTCDANEDCASCATDCGTCPGCGDGTCDANEDCGSCSQDCGACPSTCGDGTCDADEDCASCAADCGACTSCGDGTCDPGETCFGCDTDCGPCGDSFIPEVPFDYLQEPGATTSTGQLPSSIGAGEVLAFTGETASTDSSLNCQGTEQNPAFIVGGTLSGSSDYLAISGSWCIFVDTVFNGMQPRVSGDHVIFRNVEVTGLAKNGMNLNGANIVVVSSEIHHNQPDLRDGHGIQVGQGAQAVWLLGNDFHHNSGNGLQACHGCDANPPSGIYIGNNIFHSDREVGIGLKYANDVIVEGNVFHSIKSARPDVEWCFDDGSMCGVWNSGSDGSAVVIGSDNEASKLTNVVVAFNEVYNTSNGFRVDESTGPQIIGNNIHDIDGNCLSLEKDGLDTVFADNTCKNATRGIFQYWRDNFSLTVDNNVFENLTEPAIEYEARNVCEASTLTSNQFMSTGGVICGNTSASTTEGVNALPGASGNAVN